MKYNIRGDKLAITDAIRSYACEKIGRLEKYFKDSELSATILVKVNGKDQFVEVTIPTSRFVLRAEEKHNDLYAAIDKASDKLERQIRKNKTRFKSKNIPDISRDFNIDFEVKKNEIDDYKIVKRKKIEMKPMDEEEAILQMNLLDHDFFLYKDINTNKTCVLYKRKDKNYGVIEEE